MLRPTVKESILQHVDLTPFGRYGFEVEFSRVPYVSITFLARREFTFKISTSSGGLGSLMATVGAPPAKEHLVVQMSPGEYAMDQRVSCDRIEDAIAEIVPWGRRIDEDLRAIPRDLDDVRAFQSKLDEILKEKVSNENERFTSSEAVALAERLEEAQERLKKLEEDHLISKSQLKELQDAIVAAKDDLAVLPKGAWYRTAGAKIWKTFKSGANTPEGRQFLADVAKKLLGMGD